MAVKGYIKHFFTCRQCSDNFMKETANITQLDPNNKRAAMIYLWEGKPHPHTLATATSPSIRLVHNHVNKRLHGDITEDPKFPKVQFPSKYLCPTCIIINTDEHDISNTMDFLANYYSAKRIDSFSVLNESHPAGDSAHRVDYIISRADSNNETLGRFNPLRSFPNLIQRYPLHTFLVFFVLLLVISRERYCKPKGKRYTR